MTKYRVSNLDLSTRIELVAEMLLPANKRNWGRITKMAQECGLTRERLYQLKRKAKTTLQEILAPQKPGRPGIDERLVVNEAMIKRAISIFPLMKGSTRDIQIGLELLFGVQRSVGYINQTLQQTGNWASVYNKQMVAAKPILAEVDEIFQGRNPCLTVVDGQSFLLLSLTPTDSRDATSWGVTFLELSEQGYEFQDVVADGARGIAAGLAATEWDMLLQPDLFHLIHEAHPISKRLERRAYQAIEIADQARLVAAEAQVPRRRGKPRQAKLPLTEAQAQETAKIETLDLWLWLLQEVRLALEPVTYDGQICSAQAARDTITTAAQLMQELGRDDVAQFAHKLDKYLDALLHPLVQLETRLASALSSLSAEDEKLIIWAWQYRQELDTPWIDWLPSSLQAIGHLFDQALSLFHRASSLAKSIHAWIRPYLQIHRGMPGWLAPLLQLWWNHHRFQRGKRAGSTPAELAGIPNPPSLAQLFATLFEAQPAMC